MYLFSSNHSRTTLICFSVGKVLSNIINKKHNTLLPSLWISLSLSISLIVVHNLLHFSLQSIKIPKTTQQNEFRHTTNSTSKELTSTSFSLSPLSRSLELTESSFEVVNALAHCTLSRSPVWRSLSYSLYLAVGRLPRD